VAEVNGVPVERAGLANDDRWGGQVPLRELTRGSGKVHAVAAVVAVTASRLIGIALPRAPWRLSESRSKAVWKDLRLIELRPRRDVIRYTRAPRALQFSGVISVFGTDSLVRTRAALRG
jgi:hypothetical protein